MVERQESSEGALDPHIWWWFIHANFAEVLEGNSEAFENKTSVKERTKSSFPMSFLTKPDKERRVRR